MGIEETIGRYLDYVFAAMDDKSLRPKAMLRLQLVAEQLQDEDLAKGDNLNRLNCFMRLFREELAYRRALAYGRTIS